MASVRPSVSRSRKATNARPSKPLCSSGKKTVPSAESKLVFVLGGARSGKSAFALKQGKVPSPRAFLATAEPLDAEMARRIHRHQQSRGPGWDTYEIPTDLSEWFAKDGGKYASVVVDCLTLWLCNVLQGKVRARQIPSHVRKLLTAMRACSNQVIMVSNEIGLGLVPGDAVSREFRDVAGRMNQLIAAEADDVHFLVSGISLRMK